MPTSTNATNPTPPYRHHTRSYIHQSLHRHHAPSQVQRLQVSRSRSLFAHILSGMAKTSYRRQCRNRTMDLRRYPLSLGCPLRNRHRQWYPLRQSPYDTLQEVQCLSHSHLRVQLSRQWTCREIALQRSPSTLQGSRWPARQVGLRRLLRLLGRTHHSSQTDGDFTLLHSHWYPPTYPPRRHRSNVPTSTPFLSPFHH